MRASISLEKPIWLPFPWQPLFMTDFTHFSTSVTFSHIVNKYELVLSSIYKNHFHLASLPDASIFVRISLDVKIVISKFLCHGLLTHTYVCFQYMQKRCHCDCFQSNKLSYCNNNVIYNVFTDNLF